MNIEEFSNSNLTIDGDFLLDEKGSVVMSYVEHDVMKKSAEIITKNRGDILNIGFGLGIIDKYIQEYKPKSHTIIEINKSLVKKMIKDGWDDKCNIICSDWKPVLDEYIKNNIKFDGIYRDTFQYIGSSSLDDFDKNYISKLLKPGGVFSTYTSLGINRLKQIHNWAKCSIEYITYDFDKDKYKNSSEKIRLYLEDVQGIQGIPIIKNPM